MTGVYNIKLTGSWQHVSKLRRSLVVRALSDTHQSQQRSMVTYYDTPERSLRDGGFMLSVLAEEGEIKQRVICKSGVPVAAPARCTTDQADLLAPTNDADCDALLAAAGKALAPHLQIARLSETHHLKRRNTQITLRLENNSLIQGPQSAFDYCVAQFDAPAKGLSDLFETARLCLEESAGALSPILYQTDEQAMEQLLRPAACLAPANKTPIDSEGSAGEALAASLQGTAARLCELRPLFSRATPFNERAELLRHMRVALRRFRAIAKIFTKQARDPELAALTMVARDHARLLGSARDWMLFLQETLPEIGQDEALPLGAERLSQQAQQLAQRRWLAVMQMMDSGTFDLFILDVMRSAACGRWQRQLPKRLAIPVRGFAVLALEKRRMAARRDAQDLSATQPSAGHPLRIALKKLRYGAQLFRDCFPREGRKPYMAAMSQLQDAFGVLNDAVVAKDLAYEAALSWSGSDDERDQLLLMAGHVAGYKAAQAGQAAEEIIRLWAAFDALAPFWSERLEHPHVESKNYSVP